MRTTPLALPPGRSPGRFANRPLAVTLGSLIAVVVLAFGALLSVLLAGLARVDRAEVDLDHYRTAQALTRQLDSRSGELAAGGYEVLVPPGPRAELQELAGDAATAEDLLAQLGTIPLAGDSAAKVADLTSRFGDYTDAVSVSLQVAVTDQVAGRARWEDIQRAGDLSDEAVGAAQDALDAATTAAHRALTDERARAELIGVVTVVALALILALGGRTMRWVARPVAPVRAALGGPAAGDPTVGTGVCSAEETSAGSPGIAPCTEEMGPSIPEHAAEAAQAGEGADGAAGPDEVADGAAAVGEAADRAVAAARSTAGRMAEPGASSVEIDHVMKVVRSIPEQTTLLALNAAIEAARAGEDRRGSAVVAGRAGKLARETATSTEDIAQRVEVDQGDTTAAVTAREFAEIVAHIGDGQVALASAVEEQTATVQAMSRSVTEATVGA